MAEVVGGLILAGIGAEAAGATVLFGSVTVATAVGTTALIGASIGLSLLTAPGKTAAAAPNLGASTPTAESGHQALRQPIPPRIVGYGRNRLSGAYMLFEEQDGVSYDVQAMHHGRIVSYVSFYLHDDPVDVVAGVVQGQSDGRYGGDNILIDTLIGAFPSNAFANPIAAMPTIWTTDHRGDGIASVNLQCNAVSIDDFTIIYPRSKPELSAVMDCAPLFDSRVESHRIVDEGTWEISYNPVVQLIDKLTHADRGMGLDRDILITPVLTALNDEADLCDEAVERADGSIEPRYRSSGFFALDSDDADIVNAILDTCDGWISENGDGSLACKVGVYRAPTLSFTSDHILGASIQWGVPDEELVNELTIDYTEPLAAYKTVDGDPWRDEDSISETGRTRSQRFSLPWVQSHTQARRLAKRRMARLNAALRGTITTTLYGLRGLGERWIRIDAPEIVAALSDIVIEVRGVTIDLANKQLTFRFVSVNPNEIDAWDPAIEEGTSINVPEKLIAPEPPVPANPAGEIFNANGLEYLRITFDDTGRSDLRFEWQWRTTVPGSDPFVSGSTEPATFYAPGRQQIVSQGLGFGTATSIDYQVRSIAPHGSPGYSAFSSVFTTP